MEEQNIGYYEDPKNGDEIIRSRTTEQIRSWDFPRSLKSLEKFKNELGTAAFPGLYLLIETRSNKVYAGEAEDIYNRIKTHSNNPEDKIKNWDRVIIINDGRPANQSDFNDNVVRLELEYYLISLLKANKYKVVSIGAKQTLNGLQKVSVDKLLEELDFFLLKKGVIHKLIAKRGQEEVMLDDLKKILSRYNYDISRLSAYEGEINDEKVFIRAGSEKAKGWQVTFRDRFKKALEEEHGSLLMPRDGILLIPFSKIKEIVLDEKAFSKNTIDIFISFEDDKIKIMKRISLIIVSLNNKPKVNHN